MLENIKINPEFERLIPPLVDDEFELLERNIVLEGEIYTPLFTWNGYIIDGHHRYKILCKHENIKFGVVEKEFENKYEAMAWMCNNQLGRRNLSAENRRYLIGKRYDAEKTAKGACEGFRGNQYKKVVKGQNDPLPNKSDSHLTREQIAKETGTSASYVKVLREQLEVLEATSSNANENSSEINRLTDILKTSNFAIEEYDDLIVRRTIECIRVMSNKTIIIIFKGGFEMTESLEDIT